MSGISPALLAFGAANLAGLLAAPWLWRRQVRGQARAARLAATLAAYAPAAVARPEARRSRRAIGAEAAWPRTARALLRLEARRTDLYPAPWGVLLAAAGLACGGVAFAAGLLLGPVAWFAWPVSWLLAARALFGHFLDRWRQRLYRQLPDALAMVVRAVRAGIPVTEAIATVGRESPQPSGGEFARAAAEISIGVITTEAVWQMAERAGLPEYRFLAVALSLQGQTGGNLTETLDNLADVIRKRMALRNRGQALTAEARASALVLAALPFVAAGGLALISPDYLLVFFTDPRGRHILFAGIASLLLGIFSMRFIVRRTLA